MYLFLYTFQKSQEKEWIWQVLIAISLLSCKNIYPGENLFTLSDKELFWTKAHCQSSGLTLAPLASLVLCKWLRLLPVLSGQFSTCFSLCPKILLPVKPQPMLRLTSLMHNPRNCSWKTPEFKIYLQRDHWNLCSQLVLLPTVGERCCIFYKL